MVPKRFFFLFQIPTTQLVCLQLLAKVTFLQSLFMKLYDLQGQV